MPAIDQHGSNSEGLDSPADNAAVVTPHDTNELAYVSRALIIGTAGDLKVTTKGGDTVTLPNVPAGILPLRVKQVFATGTDASDISAIW